jgi:hypothetical protein
MIIRSGTIFSLLLVLSSVTYAQAEKPDMNCPQKMVFQKAETPPVYKHGMEKMKAFFADAGPELVPPNAHGTIELNVIICYQDEAVLSSLVNKTNMFLDTMPWKRHFEDMKGWKAGRQNGRYISFSIRLTLEIKNGVVMKVKYSNGATTIESALHRSRRRIYTSSLSV